MSAAELVKPLSETLLHLSWQLGLLGLLAALLLRVLHRRSAQLRYALCTAALLLSLLLAALQLGARWSATEGLALPAAAVAHLEIPAAPQAALPLRADAVGDETEPLPVAPVWRFWLVAAWAGGVVLMALRLVAGLLCVARWRRAARPAPPAWQARLDRLAAAMGLRRPVVLALLPEGQQGYSPFTVGGWRPVVLMPAALLSGMPVALLEALLAHELAHVRRWDYLAQLLQRVVEALLFFHPAIWWLSRRLRVERELVADAIAAQCLASPRQLALALQSLAETEAAPALALAAAAPRDGELLQRVKALIQPPQARRGGLQLASSLGLLALLMALLAAPLLPGMRAVAAPAQAAAVAPSGVEGAAAEPAWRQALSQVELAAPRVLVQDADSGEVLLARDAQTLAPVGSISKLMTALVVLQAGQDLTQELRVGREELREAAHSSAGLWPGQRLSREAALQLMLVASDNRAALLLARHYPGGREAFERAMVAQTQRLGLRQTQLAHPTGGPQNSRASAADVARLLELAAQQPQVREAAGAAQARVLIDGRERVFANTNPLLGAPDWDIRLSKTGYTSAAGGCLAVQMRAAGRRLNVVLLGTPELHQRLEDLQRIQDALRG